MKFNIGDVVIFNDDNNEGTFGTKKGSLYKVVSEGWHGSKGTMYEFEDLEDNNRKYSFYGFRVSLYKESKSNGKPSWL